MEVKEVKEKKALIDKLGLDPKEKRAIGSMLGMAIGDAMGARYEFQPYRYGVQDLKDMGNKDFSNFGMEPGQWTDDTSMGLCLADSLIMNKGKLDQDDLMHRFLCWWNGGYNNAFRFQSIPRHSVGLGGNISLSFKEYKKHQTPETSAGDKNTSGNGSIMRNAAVPVCFYYDMKLACDMARKQSLVTHQGVEARECCALLTHIIVKIFNNEPLLQILDNLGKTFETKVDSVKYLASHKQEGNDENRNWDWTVPQYHYSPERSHKHPGYVGSYAMDNMAMSLNTIYNTKNFRDALIRIVNIRGDSDSVASVVGQIAGAYYPIEEIPGDWIKAIYQWDHGDIALKGYMLSRLKDNQSYVVK
jgi:ADP-ribosylglycohydrolase